MLEELMSQTPIRGTGVGAVEAARVAPKTLFNT